MSGAKSIENLAGEIGLLQKPEIRGILSSDTVKHISSSRVHYEESLQNCERICGLSRIVRSLVIPSLENIVTWHERDLTQSSAERFIIPQACILVDDMLQQMGNIIASL